MSQSQTSLFDFEEAGLTLDPNNTNEHNKKNLDAIDQSVDEVGFYRSIGIDENNVVLVGNGTTVIAEKRGAKILIVDVDDPNTLVAVRRKGMTDVEKFRAAQWDNQAARLSKQNNKALQRLVKANPGQMLLEGIYTEKEQSKILREHENAQELSEGGADDVDMPELGLTSGPKPESSTRTVSLFFQVDALPRFVGMVKALEQRLFDNKGRAMNMTDTIEAIVERAFQEWLVPEDDKDAEAAAYDDLGVIEDEEVAEEVNADDTTDNVTA